MIVDARLQLGFGTAGKIIRSWILQLSNALFNLNQWHLATRRTKYTANLNCLEGARVNSIKTAFLLITYLAIFNFVDVRGESNQLLTNPASATLSAPNNIRLGSVEPPLFQSSFGSGCELNRNLSTNQHADITGKDSLFQSKNDWETDLENNGILGDFQFQFEGGSWDDRDIKLSSDPLDSENTVLEVTIKNATIPAWGDHLKGRAQANIYGNPNLRSAYISRKVFFPTDLEALRDYPGKIDWLTIEQFWLPAGWTGAPNPFRITLDVVKDRGERELHFRAKGDIKPASTWDSIWDYTAEDFDIPLGQWLTLETYVVAGKEDSGRYELAITTSEGTREVLFSLSKPTVDPQSITTPLITEWNPFMLYTVDTVIDQVREAGGSLTIFVDDLAIYPSPPGSSRL